MDYKYHHKTLKLLYTAKINFLNIDNKGKTITPQEILPYSFSGELLSKELGIKNIEKARSILANLKECNCLNSNYKKKDVYYNITDKGISKFHEQYFIYKKKEQCKTRRLLYYKSIFYVISTLGIITSIIFNVLNTNKIPNKIEKQESVQELEYLKIDSTSIIRDDSSLISNQ